jgi:hypothetical protein
MDEHKPQDSIEIIVITTAEDLDVTFNEHEPMEAVFRRALALVGGEGNPDQFNLDYDDQPLTDLHRPISDFAAQFGWERRVELELVPKPVVV